MEAKRKERRVASPMSSQAETSVTEQVRVQAKVLAEKTMPVEIVVAGRAPKR